MNTLLSPYMIVTSILALIAVFAGTIYLMSRIRKDDMQLLRNSNADLRLAMSDLKTETSNLTLKVESLSKQVTQLQSEKSELTDLVIRALTQYFNDNPTVAQTIKANLKK